MDEKPDDAGRGELTEQILGAEQDERRRIALFLHDGPVQSLAGVALMLDAVTDFLSRGSTGEAVDISSARSPAHARRSASSATSRSTSNRSSCGTRLRAWR